MMGIDRFFVTQSLREQAAILVAQFMVDVASRIKKTKSRDVTRVIDDALNQLYAEVAAYTQEHKLGVIRRAAFALAIQNALKEQKMTPEVASKVTGALVMNALIAQKKP